MISSKKAGLLARRKAVVANGIGIFNPATVTDAKGSVVTELGGRELIDFAGGIGVINTGHCPEPVVQAIKEQADKFLHTCFNVAAYDVYVDLAEKLTQLFPHGESTKVMITTTGAESVENAIKIARQATRREAVICFTGAFHGRTMMAMSLTSKTAYKKDCGPFAPELYRLPFPNFFRYGDGLTEEAFVDRELKRLREALVNMVDASNVAAVIIEPVQGEGGFIPAPKRYIQELRKICTEHGIMLILDEVQSGFGRTGDWAAYNHYNVVPDISTWAKSMGAGMPIGAVIGRGEVMDAAQAGTIGGTYPGNPVCCAAALANIHYMEEIDINALGIKVGNIIRQRFEAMQAKCSAVVDVRGLGAMMAFELQQNGEPASELCKHLLSACYDRGLILLAAGTGKNVVRVLSPLVISDEMLHRGLDIIEEELMRLTNA